jgi:hypothetical protein
MASLDIRVATPTGVHLEPWDRLPALLAQPAVGFVWIDIPVLHGAEPRDDGRAPARTQVSGVATTVAGLERAVMEIPTRSPVTASHSSGPALGRKTE